jgi:cytochrome bd-type quinol oxidase subunit 2
MHDKSPRRTSADLGQLLTAVYVVFVVAAVGRSSVQLASHAWRAPIAYGLSSLAAVVYVASYVALRAADRNVRARTWAVLLCGTELVGVLSVGAFSVLSPRYFPESTIWSQFGVGYGYVPLVLPICALTWLRSRRVQRHRFRETDDAMCSAESVSEQR